MESIVFYVVVGIAAAICFMIYNISVEKKKAAIKKAEELKRKELVKEALSELVIPQAVVNVPEALPEEDTNGTGKTL